MRKSHYKPYLKMKPSMIVRVCVENTKSEKDF